jgi:hypothetical protein
MALQADRFTVQDNSTRWEDSNDVATIYNDTKNVGNIFCLHVAIGYKMLVCNSIFNISYIQCTDLEASGPLKSLDFVCWDHLESLNWPHVIWQGRFHNTKSHLQHRCINS